MANTFNFAGMVDLNKIQYSISPEHTISSPEQIKVYDGERKIKITSISSLNESVDTAVIEVDETLDICGNYTVEIEGYQPIHTRLL